MITTINIQFLPFGLSSSEYIFTKVVRELIKFWRSTGVKIIMYLDDGLGGSRALVNALYVRDMIKSDFEKFGFLLAHEKCNWLPCQNLEWLEFV